MEWLQRISDEERQRILGVTSAYLDDLGTLQHCLRVVQVEREGQERQLA